MHRLCAIAKERNTIAFRNCITIMVRCQESVNTSIALRESTNDQLDVNPFQEEFGEQHSPATRDDL